MTQDAIPKDSMLITNLAKAFADEDVSRKQCRLTYDDNNWYISDGDGHNESSNGTWFYPEKYFTITEGMIIRMGTTSFECSFIS